jgi:hypothetical protein
MFEVVWKRAPGRTYAVTATDAAEAGELFAVLAAEVRLGDCLWVELWEDGDLADHRDQDRGRLHTLRDAKRMIETAYRGR